MARNGRYHIVGSSARTRIQKSSLLSNEPHLLFFFFSTKRFAVAAESFDDIVAGVAFAAKHNLRVAVKGTGHDWFGQLKRNTLRSAA